MRRDDPPSGDRFGLADPVHSVDGLRLFRRRPWQLGSTTYEATWRLRPTPAAGEGARHDGDLGIATTVGFAFSLAAAAFAPLLILGVWWRRLSRAGAVSSLVVGALAATSAAVTTYVAGPLDGWAGALLANPAAWCTPLAFATTIIVSLAPVHDPP